MDLGAYEDCTQSDPMIKFGVDVVDSARVKTWTLTSVMDHTCDDCLGKLV